MKLTVTKNHLTLFVLMFVLLGHAIMVFDNFHVIDLLFSLARYLCFFLVLYYYAGKYRFRFHRFDVLWLVFFVYLLFTTFIGKGHLLNVIGPAIDIMLLMMVFYVCEDDLKILLNVTTVVMSFYIYFNFFLVLLYPDGLWEDPLSGNGYFLLSGNYNGMGARFVCALITNMICIREGAGRFYKLNFFVLYAVSLFTAVFVGSMTTTVCLILLLLLWLAARTRWHVAVVIGFFVIYLLCQTVIVFTLSDLSTSDIVVGLVENVLHKDLTFTKRAFLWENSSFMIGQSPLVGYGFQDKSWNEIYLDGPGSHNFVYTMLLYGGFPLLLLFIAILVEALKVSRPYGDNIRSSLLLGINVIFFMMIFEYYTFFLIAYLLILLYFYPHLSSLPKDA